MNQPEKIKNLFKKSNVNVEPGVDKRILDDTSAAMQKRHAAESTPVRNLYWRIIMQSKITKLVAAAVIIIAAAVCIHYFNLSLDGTSVALAEVAEKVNQYNTLTHKERRVITFVGEEEPWLITDVVKYAWADYGLVEEQYDTDGNLLYRMYVLRRHEGVIMLFPECKQFLLVPLNEAVLQRFSQINPQGLVNWFLSDEYTCLGRREIDGRIAEGFEIINPTVCQEFAESSHGFFPIEWSKMTLWIDVETEMPVLGESEGIIGECLLTSFRKVHIKAESYDLEWGIELDPNIFDPNIPADYTPFNPIPTNDE